MLWRIFDVMAYFFLRCSVLFYFIILYFLFYGILVDVIAYF